MNNITLREAIENNIKHFIDNGDFSIFNITQKIRRDVQRGLQIANIFNVYHSEVRKEFLSALDDIINSLDCNVSIKNNGQYNIYTFTRRANSSNPSVKPTQAKQDDDNNLQTIVTSFINNLPKNSAPSKGKTVVAKKTNSKSVQNSVPKYLSELERRIVVFIQNKNKEDKTYTYKQVQSAIKRGNQSTGVTVKDIKEIIDRINI